MFIRLLIVLKFTTHFSSATTQESHYDINWQSKVFHYIMKNFEPSQITLFLRNSRDEDLHNVNGVLKNIVKDVSTMIVDTKVIKADDSLFQHPSFWYPRPANVFVIAYPSKNLIKRSDVNKVRSIIDLMADIAPKPTRPRCLLIIFGTNFVPKRIVELISQYAWSRKFLDFTTLILRTRIKCSLLNNIVSSAKLSYHYYNPFSDKHFSATYQTGAELLPNKLKNLYGYRIVVAATNNPPYVILDRNETGYPILNETGSNYRILRILRKAMNFTIELAPSTFEYYTEGNNESLVYRLLTGEINLSMNHLFLSKVNTLINKLERSVITISEEYTALMPITLDKRVHIPNDVLSYTFCAVGMFIVFYFLMHVMRFDRGIWSGTVIIEILLNVNIRQPVRWRERLIFFCITFLGFNFTINAVTELTEIQFEPYDDLASNDFRWMSKRNYTPVVLEQLQDVSLEDEILQDKAFIAKLKTLKNAEECAFRLARGEKIVCLMTKYLAKPLIMEDVQKNLEPTIKLMKPYLWSSWKTIVFEPGSPFLDGFNSKLERLRDVGLLKRFVYDVTYHEQINKKSEEDILDTKVITTKWLFFQLLSGYVLAASAFGLEILKTILKNRIRRVCQLKNAK